MNKKPIDFPILLTTVILVAIGVVMVFSASFYYSSQRWGDSLYFFKRQCLWAVIGFAAMFVASRIDYSKLQKYSRIFLIISIIMLVAVLIIGEERNGAKRWLGVGSITIQPAEVAKFAVIFFISDTISRGKGKIKYFFRGMLPILLVSGLSLRFDCPTAQPEYSREHFDTDFDHALCGRSTLVAIDCFAGKRCSRSSCTRHG
jgi:cell division protein FtsW